MKKIKLNNPLINLGQEVAKPDTCDFLQKRRRGKVMQPRFLRTSDWQLGVTRHFLNDDSQARWSEARFEGVRNIGRIAHEEGCEFIVVAGDIFESNQVDRKTVLKACEVNLGEK
jgi:hypothetical protein